LDKWIFPVERNRSANEGRAFTDWTNDNIILTKIKCLIIFFKKEKEKIYTLLMTEWVDFSNR